MCGRERGAMLVERARRGPASRLRRRQEPGGRALPAASTHRTRRIPSTVQGGSRSHR